jgi:hypothetical protein
MRNRIKGLRVVPANTLLPNPKNWRTHPDRQRKAMHGILEEVGYAAAAIARELPDGRLMLIDGHLRTETADEAGQDVPVLVLDVTEEEADKLLLTLDPIAEMAETDNAVLMELLESVETDNAEVSEMLANLLGKPREVDYEGGEYESNEDSASFSGVRMVQLFLDESNISEFQNAIHSLEHKYGTSNTTDTTLEALRRASSQG